MTVALPALYTPAPLFHAPSARNPNFSFDTLGGRPVSLTFLGSARHAVGAQLAADLAAASERYPGDAVFCAVTFDAADRAEGARLERPRFVVFHDGALELGKRYGVVMEGAAGLRPLTFVLDYRLRLHAIVPVNVKDAAGHIETVLAAMNQVPRPEGPVRQTGWAPVLEVPRVLEPELCQRLIQLYDSQGGRPSGFMREREGKTFGLLDPSFKRRSDAEIGDETLKQACRQRVALRLLPEIQRAFQFTVTRIERDIVACYDAEPGGFFKAHRDNTTGGTAHRRFAVTINLNAEDYEGGDLRFPEYGTSSYRAPTGGAVVFSCSLLHEALPVTKGRRYAYLPFLYDETAAEIRRKNLALLDPKMRGPDEKTVVGELPTQGATSASQG